MIHTLEEAFAVIEKAKDGFALDAVEFLYNYPSDKRIDSKILSFLETSCVRGSKSEEQFEHRLNVAVRYSIVAENHLSLALIPSLIGIYSSPDNLYDDLCDDLYEQGLYLIDLLCEKYGEDAIQLFIDAIDKLSIENSNFPEIYIFECLFFCDKEKHKIKLLEIAERKFPSIGSYLEQLAAIQFTGVIPIIEQYVKAGDKIAGSFDLSYLSESLEELKTGSPSSNKPYKSQRSEWKAHYTTKGEWEPQL